VAVIGAGGIGFDVSEFLTHAAASGPGGKGGTGVHAMPTVDEYYREWGIDPKVRCKRSSMCGLRASCISEHASPAGIFRVDVR
jgi:2,4-dienoyl-CoA reductase (NADPH2)